MPPNRNDATESCRMWLMNDADTYAHCVQLAKACKREVEQTQKGQAWILLSDALEAYVEETMLPEIPNGLASELLNDAFHSIDFDWIARYVLEGLK